MWLLGKAIHPDAYRGYVDREFQTRLMQPDPTLLSELLTYKMPFGKHKGKLLRELPVSYLEWMAREGFPKGKLGQLLGTLYEIKINGLDYLLSEIGKLKS